jgi:hypothetical protein
MIEVIVILVLVISFIKEYKNPEDKMGDDTLISLLISGALVIFVFIFIHSVKLITKIDENGISYQFFPILFKPKKISWSDLSKCYVRKYSPISEYGGWGIRGLVRQGIFDLSGNGKAFNIKGNIGIQLEYKDGGKLLIGTQQSENAKNVIKNYFDKMDSNSVLDY